MAGTALGSLLGGRLRDRIRETVLDSLGLVTIVVGVGYAVLSKNILIPLGCLLVGGIGGELLRIENRLDSGAERLRRWLRVDDRVGGGAEPGAPSTFAQGFVVASLVFCVGPLTILGSFQNGLTGHIDQLALKAALDGFAALAFASALGWGVGVAAVTVLVYQGALSLGASALSSVLTERMILETNALGGLLIMGIGLRLLELKKVRVANMLPGIVLAPLAVAIFVR